MSKSKKELNPKVIPGDRIMCLHMDGETSVPMGTTGTVSRVTRDPFEDDGGIINVRWDNGSNLALLSVTDSWVKIAQETLTEDTGDRHYDYFKRNPEIFENFDWRFLKSFLKKLRDASPVNMFQAAPFLYSGREWIDRHYGEDQEDNEDFQEMLDMADEAKDKMIEGIISYMDSKGLEVDVDRANHYMRKFSNIMLELYIKFS
jgi:hypothetical protein